MNLETLVSAKAQLEAGLSERRVLNSLHSECAGRAEAPYSGLLQMAQACGTSLAMVIDMLIERTRANAAESRQIETALRGPQFSAKLLFWLPLSSVVFAQLIGLNPLQLLLFKPLGWLLIFCSCMLSFMAQRWSSALVVAAQQQPADESLGLEALIIGLRAGLSISAAKKQAQLSGFSLTADFSQIESQARESGIALTPLLQSQCNLIRESATQTRLLMLTELPQKLLLPTGLLLLPACLLTSVLPVAIAAIGSNL